MADADAAVEAALMVSQVRTMDLRPDDVLVILVPHKLSPAVAERIRMVVRERFGHQRVLVLDGGLDVAVVRPQDVEAAGR